MGRPKGSAKSKASSPITVNSGGGSPGVLSEVGEGDDKTVGTIDSSYMSGADFYTAMQEKEQCQASLQSIAEGNKTTIVAGTRDSIDRFRAIIEPGQGSGKGTLTPILQKSKRKFKKDSTNVLYHKIDVSRRRVRNEGSRHVGPYESGMGLMAMRFINAGDMLFNEKAFVSFKTGAPPEKVALHVRATLSKFTKNRSREAAFFVSLHTAASKASGTNADEFEILREYGLEYGGDKIGVFVNYSSMRHSCSPNVEMKITEEGTISAHAIRDIFAGEEITHSLLNDLFASPEERHHAYRLVFPYAAACRCFVCEANDVEENLRRQNILAKLITVQGVYNTNPNTELKAIEHLITVLEEYVPRQTRKSEQTYIFRDVKLLRQMHAKASQLSLRLNFHYDGMRHLTLAAGYFALSFGLASPETQRIMKLVEKRGLQPCPIQNLPIMAKAADDVHQWGAPGDSMYSGIVEPEVHTMALLQSNHSILAATELSAPDARSPEPSFGDDMSRVSPGLEDGSMSDRSFDYDHNLDDGEMFIPINDRPISTDGRDGEADLKGTNLVVKFPNITGSGISVQDAPISSLFG